MIESLPQSRFPDAKLCHFSFPSAILRRGFWLYVWRVTLRDGSDLHYVGRTGDSSSLNAQSPFSRVSGHLGSNKNANALRRHLAKRSIDTGDCDVFELVALGPLHEESATETEHRHRRDGVAALERELCDQMRAVGYAVLNSVQSRMSVDSLEWAIVCAAFAERFPRLRISKDDGHLRPTTAPPTPSKAPGSISQ